MRNREVPKKINKAKRNFFCSLFTPIKPTPESFFPKDQFDLLDEKSRNLVNEANNNPNQQFLLGKYLIEGEYGFRRNIEIAIKYLNYSIDESCIESAVYYSNMLIKGDIILQDIKKALSILSKFLSTNDPNILFLYAKIMKKQKKYQVAKEYFIKSAKEGNNQSMFEYAKMLLIEEKGNQKIDQVIYFLKTAIRNGNQKASIFLDVYNQIKSVPGFNNLPSETKKFIVSKF